MSFLKIYEEYKDFDFFSFFKDVSTYDAEKVLQKVKFNEKDVLVLLSNNAQKYLEEMAKKSNNITRQYFGNTIQLYAPLYLSNYCTNDCIYCGFKSSNIIKRKRLTIEEIKGEAEHISKTGIRHILILTGESKTDSPLSYIIEAVEVLKKYFSSISVEIYPLEIEEYEELRERGVDGVAIYQETYNKGRYLELHKSGKKKNYLFRLDTPERACKGEIRSINIGILLGLFDWRIDAFFLILHARYLQGKYPDKEISISLPRLKTIVGDYKIEYPVNDIDITQAIVIMRLINPMLGINLSTRESSDIRDNLIGLGITKMSAGSKTEVGGYTIKNKTGKQFEISDNRDVDEIKKIIYQKGYQPVFKDWQSL